MVSVVFLKDKQIEKTMRTMRAPTKEREETNCETALYRREALGFPANRGRHFHFLHAASPPQRDAYLDLHMIDELMALDLAATSVSFLLFLYNT